MCAVQLCGTSERHCAALWLLWRRREKKWDKVEGQKGSKRRAPKVTEAHKRMALCGIVVAVEEEEKGKKWDEVEGVKFGR